MDTYISHSPAETEALGEAWGRTAQSGLVIALTGDLGAGKTQLVKGLARGLGITARITSPTFALVNSYPGGRLTLHHLDLYRLDTPEQVLAAGMEEYLQPDGVSVIEWAERLAESEEGRVTGNAGPAGTHHASRIMHHFSVPRHLSLATRHLRWVTIQTASDTERRIDYEDVSY